MTSQEIGFEVAKQYFEKQSSFTKLAFNNGIKVAQEAVQQDPSMLSKALPYLGAAAAGAGAMYGGQKLYDYMTQPSEEELAQQEFQKQLQQIEEDPMMYGAYDSYQDPMMYGAYEEPMMYGAYDDPYSLYGAYDNYSNYMV